MEPQPAARARTTPNTTAHTTTTQWTTTHRTATTDRSTGPDLPTLVAALADADSDAWTTLVTRYRALLRSVARRYRLAPDDAADLEQTCWLRLFEHLHRLHSPWALPGWLRTTAEREALRMVRQAGRTLPDSEQLGELPDARTSDAPEALCVRRDADRHVRAAVSDLGGRGGQIMSALLDDPDTSYAELGRALDMPIGSIGPTRGRAVERLRRDERVLALAG